MKEEGGEVGWESYYYVLVECRLGRLAGTGRGKQGLSRLVLGR
jgi:hypothetical protein